MDFAKRTNEDWEYKGADIYYLPHPKLEGNWEIHYGEKYIGRCYTKRECKIMINNVIRTNAALEFPDPFDEEIIYT